MVVYKPTGNVLVTADPHYGHKNANALCGRPFSSLQEMDHIMIENHNKVVKPNDTVFVIGDFVVYSQINWQKYFVKLNGKLHLIMGNHDKEKGYESMFESVQERGILELDKKHIYILDHYPGASWNGRFHGAGQIFGHVHGKFPGFGKSLDVGVDTHKYTPYHIDEVIAHMDSRDVWWEPSKKPKEI